MDYTYCSQMDVILMLKIDVHGLGTEGGCREGGGCVYKRTI